MCFLCEVCPPKILALIIQGAQRPGAVPVFGCLYMSLINAQNSQKVFGRTLGGGKYDTSFVSRTQSTWRVSPGLVSG